MENMNYYIFYLLFIAYFLSSDKKLKALILSILFSPTPNTNENVETAQERRDEERKTPPPEVPYQDKYLDKFQRLLPINESLDVDALKNSVVVEHTPLGNVAMYYDSKREAFVYYSDSVMPYRFLEVVARKYVITFQCKSVFVVMDDEINKAKMKIEEQKTQKALEQEKMDLAAGEEQSSIKDEPKKKNVFATFKNYNKNTTKDSSNKPTTGSSTAASANTKKGEDLILKENANHYTCDGRYSNFLVLKKVDKTLVDARLKMTFADFKKMQAKKNSS
jgi:hypothetical protein